MPAPPEIPVTLQCALQRRFAKITVRADHAWPGMPTRVLEADVDGRRCIIKVFDPDNHHFERELQAHREFLAPLRAIGAAPDLVHVDEGARWLITSFLPGTLVQGSEAEWDGETYRQAGVLLAVLHGQAALRSSRYVDDVIERLGRLLADQHRIDPSVQKRVEESIGSIETVPAQLVPCHGDFQPRNWLINDGTVALIDFGRGAWRTRQPDLVRLEAQQFRGRSDLEAAFTGYGADPREHRLWGLA